MALFTAYHSVLLRKNVCQKAEGQPLLHALALLLAPVQAPLDPLLFPPVVRSNDARCGPLWNDVRRCLQAYNHSRSDPRAPLLPISQDLTSPEHRTLLSIVHPWKQGSDVSTRTHRQDPSIPESFMDPKSANQTTKNAG